MYTRAFPSFGRFRILSLPIIAVRRPLVKENLTEKAPAAASFREFPGKTLDAAGEGWYTILASLTGGVCPTTDRIQSKRADILAPFPEAGPSDHEEVQPNAHCQRFLRGRLHLFDDLWGGRRRRTGGEVQNPDWPTTPNSARSTSGGNAGWRIPSTTKPTDSTCCTTSSARPSSRPSWTGVSKITDGVLRSLIVRKDK